MIKTAPFIPPASYERIKVVSSFDALMAGTFGPEINAICWQRTLTGDFDELAASFSNEDEIISLDEELLNNLRPKLSAMGRAAAGALLEDRRLLKAHGLSPSLECVPRYQRDEISRTIPTDVYSFHADRATVPTDTFLCSYNEAATEGLRNDMAQRHIDIPAVRSELLKLFQQEEETGDFITYLRENSYDLHYAETAKAASFSFGIGKLLAYRRRIPRLPGPALPAPRPENTARKAAPAASY